MVVSLGCAITRLKVVIICLDQGDDAGDLLALNKAFNIFEIIMFLVLRGASVAGVMSSVG